MFLFPRAASGSAVPATLVRPIASSALLLSLPAVNAETATHLNGTVPVENRLSSSTSTSTTRTGLPTLLLLTIVLAVLFVVTLTAVVMFFQCRRLRDRKKRSEHYEKTLEFQAMARKGLRPNLGGVTTPVPVFYPSSNAQATLPPLVPNRAYAV